MCLPTSGTHSRCIEPKMHEEKPMFLSHEMFVEAEVAYRREQLSPRPRRKARRARRHRAGRAGAMSQPHGVATA